MDDPYETGDMPNLHLVAPREQHDEMDVMVHYGHCATRRDIYDNFGRLWSLPGLRTEDYLRYASEVQHELRRRSRDGVPLIAMSQSSHEDRTREYLGDLAGTVDVYVPTSDLSAYPVDDGPAQLARGLSTLDSDGTVRVSGELHGLCQDQAMDIVGEMLDRLGKDDATVETGRAFPEEPVKRVDGSLYWASEDPITRGPIV